MFRSYLFLSFTNTENIAIMNVECGNVIIELDPNTSPNSVQRFKTLIKNGSYDGSTFYRVIKNTLIQAGDIEYGIRASNLKIPILLCPRFQGRCENDLKFNLFKDYYKGKKLIKSYYVLTKKYGGFLWILHFLSALLNSLKIFKLK